MAPMYSPSSCCMFCMLYWGARWNHSGSRSWLLCTSPRQSTWGRRSIGYHEQEQETPHQLPDVFLPATGARDCYDPGAAGSSAWDKPGRTGYKGEQQQQNSKHNQVEVETEPPGVVVVSSPPLVSHTRLSGCRCVPGRVPVTAGLSAKLKMG